MTPSTLVLLFFAATFLAIVAFYLSWRSVQRDRYPRFCQHYREGRHGVMLTNVRFGLYHCTRCDGAHRPWHLS